MDPTIYLSCLLAFTFSCFIQSTVGFGMGIIVGPILLLVEPRLMPSAILVIAICLSAIVWFQYRKSFSPRILVAAFIGRLPGTLIATYVLMVISTNQLEILLGFTILVAVILSLFKVRLAPTSLNLFIGGLLSGIFGTATGIGGPPVAMLMQNESPETIRSNLAAFFGLTSVISLIALHYSGRFTSADFISSISLLPAPIVATFIAYKIRNKIHQGAVRYATLVICSLSAIVALSQGFNLIH